MKRTVIRWFLLSLCFVSLGSDVTAQQQAPKPTAAWSPVIYVTHVTDTSGRQPSTGAEVVFETWVQSQLGDKELRRTQVGVTDADGRVTFRRVAVQRNVSFRATTIRDGLTFATSDISGFAPSQPLQLQTYERTQSTKDLKFDVRAELEVREEVLLVRMRVGVSNTSMQVIESNLEQGIRSPMLLPSIGDTPWVGYLPTEKATANISVSTVPSRGVLRVHRGSVYFSGPIFPGQGSQEWRLVYVVPITRPDLQLVLQSDHKVASVAFIGAWANSLAPRIDASVPYESEKFERAGRVIHRLVMPATLGPDDVVELRVSGLPYALSAESNLALFGGGFLFVLFLLFALGTRPQA